MNNRILSRRVIFISVNDKISLAVYLAHEKEGRENQHNQLPIICLFLFILNFLMPPSMGIIKLRNIPHFKILLLSTSN